MVGDGEYTHTAVLAMAGCTGCTRSPFYKIKKKIKISHTLLILRNNLSKLQKPLSSTPPPPLTLPPGPVMDTLARRPKAALRNVSSVKNHL